MTTVFFALGATAGTWAARIPAIKGSLHLSAGTLGLVLLGPAVGSVLAMPAVGAILATVAPRRIVLLGMVIVTALLPVTVLADSAWQLFAVLTAWGAGAGMVDVAMNTEAAAVQVQLGRRSMSGFHAAYSVGGLAGAGLGAIAAAYVVSAGTNFLAAAAVLMVIGVASARAFTASPAPRSVEHDTRRLRRPQWSWTLALLAAVAFGSFLVEGAANDWSAVYLHSSLRASPAVAAGAYAIFACAMTAGRLVGDRLADLVGPTRLVRLSAGVAAVSFGGALLAGRVGFGLVGFAVLGAGVSFVVPLVFTAASDLGRPGPNLAVVSSSGYLGMLIGPPLIGGLAEIIGLAGALSSVVVLCALIAILAPVVGDKSSPASGTDAAPQKVAVL